MFRIGFYNEGTFLFQLNNKIKFDFFIFCKTKTKYQKSGIIKNTSRMDQYTLETILPHII